MRVIAGSKKGAKLLAPEGLDTRPTLDRIRESLFNIIAPDINGGVNFLDLFSGTGAIGIEALSRGSDFAVFVDNSPKCIDIITKNLRHVNFLDKSKIMFMEFTQAIEALKGLILFDIIFIDPPYNKGYTNIAINDIISCGLLRKHGIIIVEQSSKDDISHFETLELYKEKKYKTTTLLFYKLLEGSL